ncbi:MAG: hypothetical protein QOE19_1598, partial [Actinomycetota bacterium]|nr:hypothetical protein [Actinomycetota bacterium]
MAATRSGRRRGAGSALRWRVNTWVRRHLLYSDGFALILLSLAAAGLGLLNALVSRTV